MITNKVLSKPKTARSKRAMEKKAPQVHEGHKMTLFLRYTSTSEIVNLAMTDLHSLKRPLCVKFSKKNPIHPFEDATSLEFFAEKNDASLFVFGSHSKKRPNTITLARMFDYKVLDMLELHIDPDTFRTLSQFKNAKARVGLKPLISFSGTAFESPTPNAYTMAKSLFLDFFRGEDTANVDVEGLQYMIHISVGEEVDNAPAPKIQLRAYMIKTKKSGQTLPRVEVEEMGPRIDFRVGRVREADPNMLKEAMRKPKGTEVSDDLRDGAQGNRAADANTNLTGQDEEEHRDRHHGRQGRPYPHGKARPRRAADEEDEGPQAQQRRRRRRGRHVGRRRSRRRRRGQKGSRLKRAAASCLFSSLYTRIGLALSCISSVAFGEGGIKSIYGEKDKKVNGTSLVQVFGRHLFPSSPIYISFPENSLV